MLHLHARMHRNAAPTLALLLGSLALLMAIAGLMFLTRNLDWYHYGGGE